MVISFRDEDFDVFAPYDEFMNAELGVFSVAFPVPESDVFSM